MKPLSSKRIVQQDCPCVESMLTAKGWNVIASSPPEEHIPVHIHLHHGHTSR